MLASQVAEALRTIIRGEVLPAEPLARHTTLRVGGQADVLAFPGDVDELMASIRFARERGLPLNVIGRGSNLIVPDEGVRGLVVNITRATSRVRFQGPDVEVGAGFPLPRLVRMAARRGLGGLESLAGVPGTVGGGLYMNAGASGQAIGDVTEEVRAVRPDGELVVLGRADMRFGYRSSRLQAGDLIALSVRLRLYPGERAAIEAAVHKGMARRGETQPLDYPNAGSIFRNPPGDHAGRLIEAAGCKGMRVGDAQVSPRHANFIVNLGQASAVDVLRLMAIVYRHVREVFGIALEPEVRLLGSSQGELIRLLEEGIV